MKAEDFYARPKEKIRPKLVALAREVARQAGLTVSGTLRMHQMVNGRAIVADPAPNPFRGAFAVSRRGGTRVRIGPGTVNGIVPRIDLTRIDGLTDDGERDPDGVPVLDLADAGPGPDLRSWICLRAIVDPETGEMDPEDRAAVQVIGMRSLARPDDWEDERGAHPIAVAIWRSRSAIGRVRQIVFFDQGHRYYPATETVRARHVWWPVS